jgi:hypothetical protein
MKGAITCFAILGLLAAAACADSDAARPAVPAAGIQTQPLFIIERSKNANVVHYDAQIGADGKLDPKQPVIAYWIMLAEDSRREELNWIEKKKAYGFSIKPDASGDAYKMTVVSAPDRQITVKQEGGVARAELDIDGKPAILEKMYINSTEGTFGPKVHYIELHGKDLKSGEKLTEKIVPK